MPCITTPPVDGPGWAEFAECLDRGGLREAAAGARRHAWEADPALATALIGPALAFAHATGDDRLVVDLAASSSDLTDPDLVGHVAFAHATPERADLADRLAAIPRTSCRYPHAQYHLGEQFAAKGQYKSAVISLRSAMESAHALDSDAFGRGPLWEAWNLADASLLRVASIYATIDRAEQASTYASMVIRGRDPMTPYGRYTVAWAAARSGDNEGALAEAAKIAEILPEASVLLVSAQREVREREAQAAAAHTFWEPVRASLTAFAEEFSTEPGAAASGLLELEIPQGTLSAAGGTGPLLTLWVRSYALGREARRARGNPAAAALVAEATDEVDQALGAGILAAVAHGLARIDAALAAVDLAAADPAVTDEDQRAAEPHNWTAKDFGW